MMASLLKNQILKHLSKFAKNLTPDKIKINTMRGRGEMTSLELDEEVLTGLLELPAWMRITRVWCNRVSVCIQWTNLKSMPIRVELDEVQVGIETCDVLRSSPAGQPASASAGLAGRYGYSAKVIDGITLAVNSCVVDFRSHAFQATVQLTRMLCESKTPSWKSSNDLRMTRLRDRDRGEVLIFKELQWQTVKFEARSTQDTSISPLRLITNQAHCRIVIKKKISDCSVLGCRLALVLGDLLWVLTDKQLKATVHFAESLSGLIKKATELSHKVKAVRKLESLPSYEAGRAESGGATKPSQNSSALSRVFSRFDVLETSYHLYIQRIDLHLCDDPGEGRSCAPELADGGVLQVCLRRLQLDYYPYHLAFGDRQHWVSYGESVPAVWLRDTLEAFKSRLLALLLRPGGPSHAPLARAPPLHKIAAGGGRSPGVSPERSRLLNQLRKLMTSVLVIRLDDFTVFRVSTALRKTAPREFIAGDNERMKLPGGTTSVHMELTYFYYPGNVNFPLPPPQVMAHINPVRVLLDPVTVLWLNAFACNVQRALATPGSVEPPPYLDLHLEAIMPCLVLEAERADYPLQRDRPSCLQAHTTRLQITNRRSDDPTQPGSLASLAVCLEQLQAGELAFGSQFPSRDGDLQVVPERLVLHTQGRDSVGAAPSDVLDSTAYAGWLEEHRGLPQRLLWHEPRDVLFARLEPVWLDFGGTSALRGRPVPFVDAFPLSAWLYRNRQKSAAVGGGVSAGLALVLHAPSSAPVSVQINHFQYLFLLRQLERLGEMSVCLAVDAERLLGADGSGSVAVSGVLPQVDVSLLMPVCQPLAVSSAGDMSLFPDSTSSLNSVQFFPPDGDITPRPPASPRPAHDGGYKFQMCTASHAWPVPPTSTAAAVGNHCSRLSADESSEEKRNSLRSVFNSMKMTFSNPLTGSYSGASDGEECGRKSSDGRVPWSSLGNSVNSGSHCAVSDSNDRKAAPPRVELNTMSSTSPSSWNDGPIRSQDTSGTSPSLRCSGVPELHTTAADATPPSARRKLRHSAGLVERSDSRSSTLSGGYDSLTSTVGHQVGSKFSQMRRGFSSLVSSPVHLSTASAGGAHGGSHAPTATFSQQSSSTTATDLSRPTAGDGQLDNLDAVSEMSSDSDNYILFNSETESIDPLFVVEGQLMRAPSVELASEATEDTHSEVSACSAIRRRDVISVCTLRVGGLEFVQQSAGYNSSVKVICRHVATEECNAISWDEFQAKFQLRSKGWQSGGFTGKPCGVRVRMDSTFIPVPNQRQHKVNKRSQTRVDLEVRVSDLALDMLMSTCTNLVDFIEDEIHNPPLPLEILLERVSVRLVEDRPSNNITSPGSSDPIQLYVPAARVCCDTAGVFTLLPLPTANAENSKRTSENGNSPAVRIGGSVDTSSVDLRRLHKRYRQLETRCREAEERAASLTEEREALMNTLRYLQEEFIKLDASRHKSSPQPPK